MKPSTVAVLDVGKTNKKVSLYDREFHMLGEERTSLDTREANGLEVEDTEGLLKWFRAALRHLSSKADIWAIAITTHGATAALLDGDGRLAHPVVSYTSARGAEIQDAFYAAFGDRTTLHRTTCSPDLGFANVGKMFYYMKTRMPEVYARARCALFYTSYLAYELTGVRGLEPTYLGNHSYLWDFAHKTWSSVGRSLGADKLFPGKLASPWECLGAVRPDLAKECGVPADCRVTYGIHDSNANFLPYLARGYDDFLLNSTGTWCVLMRPSDSLQLTEEEIRDKVFFNLDALNRPVRTCIFPAGMEYDTFRGFSALKDESNTVAVRQVLDAKDLFIIPGVLPDASAFPGTTARVIHGDRVYPLETLRKNGGTPFTGLDQAYNAALNVSLAFATRRSLASCGVRPGTTVFIEGGFAHNRIYCELLATLCPEQRFVLTSMKEGTAFGAAVTGWMAVEGLTLNRIGRDLKITTSDVARRDFGDMAGYEAAFMQYAKMKGE